MVEVRWSLPALRQLDEILEYIALDKPSAAAIVAKNVFARTDRLKFFPQSGRRIPEFSHPQYRQLWCRPCWIYYRVEKKATFILHVRRGERILRVEDLMADE